MFFTRFYTSLVLFSELSASKSEEDEIRRQIPQTKKFYRYLNLNKDTSNVLVDIHP